VIPLRVVGPDSYQIEPPQSVADLDLDRQESMYYCDRMVFSSFSAGIGCAFALAIVLQGCAPRPPSVLCREVTIPGAPSATAAATTVASAAAIPFDLPRAGQDAPILPAPTHADLPRSSTSEHVATAFVVFLQANGQISADGTTLKGMDDLRAAASAQIARDPEVRAVISADKDAQWGMVVTVIDQIKLAGISKIAFGVVSAAH
jgi:biopolymer transport protein ExbD